MASGSPDIKQFTQEELFAQGAFPIYVQRGHLSVAHFPMHSHDFSELVIILGGKGVHLDEDEEYLISTGDVFVVQGDQVHGFRNTDDLHLVNVMFQTDLLPLPNEYLSQLPGYHALFVFEPKYRRQHHFQSRLRLDHRAMLQVSELLELMESEYFSQTDGYQAMIIAHFVQLVVLLSRHYHQVEGETSQSVLKMGEVIRLIEHDFTKPIALVDLAKIAGLSVNQFLRVFRQMTGSTPINYLIRRRIQRATELLSAGQYNVTQAAQEVGFTDSTYFTRQFKRIMGVTPRRYLQSHHSLP